jgi:hypothetical protein
LNTLFSEVFCKCEKQKNFFSSSFTQMHTAQNAFFMWHSGSFNDYATFRVEETLSDAQSRVQFRLAKKESLNECILFSFLLIIASFVDQWAENIYLFRAFLHSCVIFCPYCALELPRKFQEFLLPLLTSPFRRRLIASSRKHFFSFTVRLATLKFLFNSHLDYFQFINEKKSLVVVTLAVL